MRRRQDGQLPTPVYSENDTANGLLDLTALDSSAACDEVTRLTFAGFDPKVSPILRYHPVEYRFKLIDGGTLSFK